MVFIVVVAVVVVALGALGWWTSGRTSSALNLRGQDAAQAEARWQSSQQNGYKIDGGSGGSL